MSASWDMKLLLGAQFKKGPHAGALTPDIARIVSDHPDAAKFNARATEIRIDYVQHALSAFLHYQAYWGAARDG